MGVTITRANKKSRRMARFLPFNQIWIYKPDSVLPQDAFWSRQPNTDCGSKHN